MSYVPGKHDADCLNNVQAALEAGARLSGHEARMTDLQRDVDLAQRLTRAAQQQAREAGDEKSSLMDKVIPAAAESWTGADVPCAARCYGLVYACVVQCCQLGWAGPRVRPQCC